MTYPQSAGPGPARTEGMAVAALVCGIASLLFCGLVLGIVAVVLAGNAQSRIAASGGRLGGEGMATVGRILGIIGIVGWVIVIAIYVSSR